MKILLLLSRVDQTGMTTNALDLGIGLKELGHEVYLLTSGPCYFNNEQIDNLFIKFKQSGFEVKEFVSSDMVDVKRSRFTKLILDVIAIIQIIKNMVLIKPDIIHVCSPYMSFIPYFLRKKFVSTLHVNDLVKCFKYKNATKLIAISRETSVYAQKVFGYKKKDITVVFNGVNLSYSILASKNERSKIKKKLKLPEDKIIIGLVGSVEFRKGHDVLLKSIQLLKNKIKSQVHVVFLGSSKKKDTDDWLRNEIEKSNCKQLISQYEYQSPKEFYDVFDLFVLPSRLEGFGLVCVEAMLSANCVVRSDTEGAFDQIEDGVDGFLFKSENALELSMILSDLVIDESMRKGVALAGRQKALLNFTHKIMAKNTLKVYEEVRRLR